MTKATLTKEQLTLAANTVRILSAEGVEKAQSGHPGMPMGMADLGIVLWLKYLKFNPKDPKWLGRDRFVLSNGHGSMFLYSMLHLSGYDLSLDDIKKFRQFESRTPGHPESFMTPGVETTTGPLGQGVSNAVGLAIGQKLMSARYTAGGVNPFDHKVFCFCGDGCMMEGVASEASSIGGHLGLNNLIVVWDDNHISIAGHTELSFTENVGARYEAYGWKVIRIDGHNYDQIDAAYAEAMSETDKPVLIAARTTIGKGSPNKCDTHDVHGAALGKDEMLATKKNLNWPIDKGEFYIPEETRKMFADRVEGLSQEYSAWQESFSAWKKANPEKATLLETQVTRTVPADLEAKLIAALPTDGKAVATRKLSGLVLNAASKCVPSLIGGSADLEPSTLTLINGSTDIEKGEFEGLNLRFGVREHGMGGVMNGLSYYGSFIPYGSTFFCFLDYMRPSVRLAALSHLPGLFIYTHESVFLGEDGPTHQPIEHLAILRMTPNILTFRPADGLETALSYKVALERKTGPSALLFTRQNLEPFERPAGFKNSDFSKGAYPVIETDGTPDVVLVASGSEVPLAVAAAKKLTGKKVRVVSMPCYELFQEQPKEYRKQLFPRGVKKVVIEAATGFGWAGMLEADADELLLICIDHYGFSATGKDIAEHLGLTPDKVAARISGFLG